MSSASVVPNLLRYTSQTSCRRYLFDLFMLSSVSPRNFLLGLLLGLGLDGLEVSYHVEGVFGVSVTLAGKDLLERVDGVFQGDELTGH